MATYTRRVQLTGGSTFIISLPSKWVKEARISKGSEVIIDDSQGVLTVTHSQARPKENARILTVTGKPNPEYFQRVLTSLYIAGFDTLTIKSPKYMDAGMVDAISRFSRLVMGVEIFDESSRSVVLQNVLDSKSFPLPNAVRRMSLNVQTMIEDTINGISGSDSALLDSVINRDDDVDRYQLYVYREVKSGESDESNSVFYLIFSRILERIADHAVNLCKLWKTVPEHSGKESESIVEFLRESGQMYNEAVDAFYAKKFDSLDPIIGKKASVTARKDEILRSLQGGEMVAIVVPSSEEIVRIGLYATDIAELAMDMILSEREEFSI
ncbi:MAG: PhoU domain-containing protein [Thermoplasmataceae archaeon]|jgi:phosphate uptake regulator